MIDISKYSDLTGERLSFVDKQNFKLGKPHVAIKDDQLFCVYGAKHNGYGPIVRRSGVDCKWEASQRPEVNSPTCNNTVFSFDDDCADLNFFGVTKKKELLTVVSPINEVAEEFRQQPTKIKNVRVAPRSILKMSSSNFITFFHEQFDASTLKENYRIYEAQSKDAISWDSNPILCCDKEQCDKNYKFCEPCALMHSKIGETVVLLRTDNDEIEKPKGHCLVKYSEGEWVLQAANQKLWGHAHIGIVEDDGTAIVCFRNKEVGSMKNQHLMCWIGSFDQLATDGGKLIKLLTNDGDGGYSGIAKLPGGEFLVVVDSKLDLWKHEAIFSVIFSSKELLSVPY